MSRAYKAMSNFLIILSAMSVVISVPCYKYVLNPTPIELIVNAEGDCNSSLTSDFDSRDSSVAQTPYYPCDLGDSWGPWPIAYPKAKVPSNCDQTAWQQQRIQQTIFHLVEKKWNYCHHHNPYWLPPLSYRQQYPNCSAAGFPNSQIDDNYEEAWYGMDCSHFTAYSYNFAFGAYLFTGIDSQACSTKLPTVVLPYTQDDQDSFQPGDILYIASSSYDNPKKISHAILWTGFKMNDPKFPQFSQENLMKNVPENQKWAMYNHWKKFPPSHYPTWVIADSHYNGPNFRPFAGWYYSAFTHARRFIGSSTMTSTWPTGRYPTYTEGVNSCSITFG